MVCDPLCDHAMSASCRAFSVGFRSRSVSGPGRFRTGYPARQGSRSNSREFSARHWGAKASENQGAYALWQLRPIVPDMRSESDFLAAIDDLIELGQEFSDAVELHYPRLLALVFVAHLAVKPSIVRRPRHPLGPRHVATPGTSLSG